MWFVGLARFWSNPISAWFHHFSNIMHLIGKLIIGSKGYNQIFSYGWRIVEIQQSDIVVKIVKVFRGWYNWHVFMTCQFRVVSRSKSNCWIGRVRWNNNVSERWLKLDITRFWEWIGSCNINRIPKVKYHLLCS